MMDKIQVCQTLQHCSCDTFGSSLPHTVFTVQFDYSSMRMNFVNKMVDSVVYVDIWWRTLGITRGEFVVSVKTLRSMRVAVKLYKSRWLLNGTHFI